MVSPTLTIQMTNSSLEGQRGKAYPEPGARFHPASFSVPTSRYPAVWSGVMSDWRRGGERGWPGLGKDGLWCTVLSDMNCVFGVTKFCKFSKQL